MTLRERHSTERHALILGRLRWCAGLALCGSIVFVALVSLTNGPGISMRMLFAGSYAAISLLASLLAACPGVHRRAPLVALGYVLGLIVLISQNYALLGDAELGMATLVAVDAGVTVLLPWGPWYQAVVGAATIVGYGWVAVHAIGHHDPSGPVLLVSMVAVAVAAEAIFERYQRVACEQTWLQEQLIAFGRDLAERTDRAEIAVKLLERGRLLLGAKSGIVALFDPGRRVYRIEHAVGGDPSFLGADVPDDCAPAPRVIAEGALALPDDDPDSPLVVMLKARDVSRLLLVAMRHGGEVVGIVAFVRKDDVPFLDAERRLAHGLSDEAAVALRTAHLIADLRAVSQLKSEFVSTMSHELRTPLNVILGYAEMVKDRRFEEEGRLDAADRIEKAARDLLELIENTLQVGRFEAGRAELQFERVALGPLWEELGERCRGFSRRSDVRLEWLPAPPGVPEINTDPRKIAIVVRNLVGNALKFTERGWVRAELRCEDDAVVIRVSDTGIGIQPEEQQTIFEMFRQADQSDTRLYGGIGLGLYIVRRAVEQLGGKVGVESMPGRGSTFTARFAQVPAARAAA